MKTANCCVLIMFLLAGSAMSQTAGGPALEKATVAVLYTGDTSGNIKPCG